MKKNGFTLAEVLITLSIIGVVAALTLPSLMTNTGEQQYKTALKKGLNTLSEAGQMNMALDGFDYSGIVEDSTATVRDGNGVLVQSLYALLAERTNMDTNASSLTGGPDNTVAVAFRDGSAIYFSSDAAGAGNPTVAIFDANGARNPNIMSTCTADTVEGCSNRNQRDIHDRFRIVLTGANAIPCTTETSVDDTDENGDPILNADGTTRTHQVLNPDSRAAQWATRF